MIKPDELLGSIILCPHCNQKLAVIAVVHEFTAGTDPSGKPNRWFPIQLADFQWARMWENEF